VWALSRYATCPPVTDHQPLLSSFVPFLIQRRLPSTGFYSTCTQKTAATPSSERHLDP
jgi:hypothetical protein